MKSDQRLKLTFFVHRLERLLGTTLSKKMFGQNLRFKIWKRPDGELEIEHPNIGNDEIDAFLLNFRLLQQNNDSISVGNITPIIKEYFSAIIIEEWNLIRAKLNAFLDDKILSKDLGSVTRREFIDAVLYGVYAHAEIEKYYQVIDWKEIIGEDALNTTFVATLETYLRTLEEFRPILAQINAIAQPVAVRQ